MERDEVIAKDQQRRGAEALLKGQFSSARRELHPRALASRFLQSQKSKLAKQTNAAKRFANDNSGWLVAGGLLSLLIAAGLPTLKRLKWRQIKDPNTQVQE